MRVFFAPLGALPLLILPLSVVYCGFPSTVLPLQRAFPPTHRVELDDLVARDRVRRGRFLQGVSGGVVDFSVHGSSDPYLVGLYYAKVKLGTPPREFTVQIDTGSDILWITCNSCSDCPQSSALGIQLNFFDASSSFTAGLIPCSDPMCSSFPTSAIQCVSKSNQCSYSFQYGDGSGTSGFYISDSLYFDMVLTESIVVNSSAPIVFGCSTYQSGDLTKADKAVDGIFGFGRGFLSVISQLSSRGITPKVFSHCLKGKGDGGGILVLGEIMDSSIVYTPLAPSQSHYNLYLQNIAVNGQPLPIDPTVFATSTNRGTIVDSGTTLAYLVEDAYDVLVSSISTIVSQSAPSYINKGYQCYLVSTSPVENFPTVSLNFMGGASLVLNPEEYLVDFGFNGGANLWCLGFQKAQEGLTILGDVVLKDKIFVYDLARERIGWANYDCSMSVNVSVTSAKDKFVAGQLNSSSSARDGLFDLLLLVFLGCIILSTW